MTQELELLLKDLCGRLPYGVKGTNAHGVIVNLDHPTDYSPYMSIKNAVLKHDYKPYLFPMSSMTEEQKMELTMLRTYVSLVKNKEYLLFDWLNANHFDYRGLINMGLAIDATNLNIY
jgi:hypothetical protein